MAVKEKDTKMLTSSRRKIINASNCAFNLVLRQSIHNYFPWQRFVKTSNNCYPLINAIGQGFKKKKFSANSVIRSNNHGQLWYYSARRGHIILVCEGSEFDPNGYQQPWKMAYCQVSDNQGSADGNKANFWNFVHKKVYTSDNEHAVTAKEPVT